MTIVEKILAARSGEQSVSPGDLTSVKTDSEVCLFNPTVAAMTVVAGRLVSPPEVVK